MEQKTNQQQQTATPSVAPARSHQKAGMENQTKANNLFADCDVIHSYTRAQAIEDGFLVDLMQDELGEVCRQHYKHPVACTSTVFEIMRKAVENKKYCNDYAGILHDMLHMSRVHWQFHGHTARLFKVIIQGAGRQRIFTFKLVCHPGDSGEPVMTIMLPDED